MTNEKSEKELLFDITQFTIKTSRMEERTDLLFSDTLYHMTSEVTLTSENEMPIVAPTLVAPPNILCGYPRLGRHKGWAKNSWIAISSVGIFRHVQRVDTTHCSI